MSVFKVTIRGSVTKILTVDADSEEDAIETAHEIFSVTPCGLEEKYNEETLGCEEVTA